MLGIARTFTLTNRKQVKMTHTTSGQNLLELMCICMLPSCCPGHGEDTYEVKPPSLQGLGAQVETPCQPAFVLWGRNKHLFNTLVLTACPSYPDWRNHQGELSTVHCGCLCLYTSDSEHAGLGSVEAKRLIGFVEESFSPTTSDFVAPTVPYWQGLVMAPSKPILKPL